MSTPDRLKIVVMGTGPFAVPAFEAIDDSGHAIALVITRPQPPIKSRSGAPASPVRRWASQHQLPLLDPVSINDAAAIDQLGMLAPDLLVVCDYGQILKPAALSTARLGGINLHGSLLPAYRGAAPVQRAMLAGEAVTGVSVIHMTPRLDAGPVLATRQTEISDQETAGELEVRLAQLGVAAVLEAVELLRDWDGIASLGQPQDTQRVSQAPRLSKSEGRIHWTRTSREIDCHVRGMQPWPGAFTELVWEPIESAPPLRLAVRSVAPLTEAQPAGLLPGDLVDSSRFVVATADGLLEIVRLQPAGRREMGGEDFLRGHLQTRTGVKLL